MSLRSRRCPTSWRVARARSARWTEYEKILFYYPEERAAYLEVIELAQRVKDEELRERFEGLLNQKDLVKRSADAK